MPMIAGGAMAARNPNPTRISDAIWRLWTEFDAYEPTALLGGVYAAKTGYHNYRGALDDDDYSVGDLLADRRGSAIKASAIDLTMSAEAMRRYTTRLDVAARARDPRLYTERGPVLREFIGTKDGSTVYCYVLVGGRPLGVGADAGPDPGRDISHLWHIHLSIIRQFCEDWSALDGVLSVLRGETLAAWRARTEEDDMTPEQLKTLTDTAWQTRNVPAPDGTRKILTGAVGQLVERVLVLEKVVAGLATASPLTETQMAELIAAAEREAREEVRDALERAADAAGPDA
jgi:hypothetical protein